tara:strand:+ start:8048 stop:8872 length:825 start_codon:yes stop_codon:yes gene_type:complete
MPRDINNPLASSIFDDDKQVESTRPPLTVSKRTGLSIPPEGGGDFFTPIYTTDVNKMNQEAALNARRNAKKGTYTKDEQGNKVFTPSAFYKGEPVDYSYEKIVKGDDGKWARQTINSKMRKPGGSGIVTIPKKKAPFLRDEKGKVVTRVGEDGIKRAVRGIQNTPINKEVKLRGGRKSTSDAGVETEKTRLSKLPSTSKKTAIKVNKPKEVNVVKSNTSTKTQRGTGKTYEDVWKNASPEYKKRFGGDKKKAIQEMKDWNAKQDAKKSKNKKSK